MEKDVKIYRSGELDSYSKNNKKFELFKVVPNEEEIQRAKEEFISSLQTPALFKVISNDPNWFYYTKGVFSQDNMPGHKMFEIVFLPSDRNQKEVISSFQEHNALVEELKAVNFENDSVFLYTPEDIMKIGRTYRALNVLPISETLYNIMQIINSNFEAVTKEDLSIYKRFIKRISETPYKTVYESELETLYRLHRITKKEYYRSIESLEKEVSLIRTLK